MLTPVRGVVFAVAAATIMTAVGCAPPAPLPTATASVTTATPPAAQPESTATATHEALGPLNPLTGLPIADPSLLKIPALLISISHFPATARPQAGLSFAPFVYEFYITEGATRFLAIFHGEWPSVELPIQGGCETRIAPFMQTATLLGNRVWADTNENGLQDPGEGGIAGLCVNLYDDTGEPIAQTTTDSNGYYGFDLNPGTYMIEFVPPTGLAFSPADAGSDDLDSDVDPASGTVNVNLEENDLSVDAGLIPNVQGELEASETSAIPLAQVGPIRSGRLLYRHIAKYFQDSCLIYASASPEVLARLPKCKVVFHQILGGGFMLDLSELWSVAKENQRKTSREFDYSGNLFSAAPPADGRPASGLRVFIAYLNQSGWFYDPLSEAYVRYVDSSEQVDAGVLHPETDRLTGRQLEVQNLIVLFAKHEVISPTNLDIHLDPGRTGKAMLFRDGLELNIDWSTNPEDGGDAGHPIQFLQKNGQPAPLKPGHTWIIVVTPETTVEADTNGLWQLTFSQPEGAK